MGGAGAGTDSGARCIFSCIIHILILNLLNIASKNQPELDVSRTFGDVNFGSQYSDGEK